MLKIKKINKQKFKRMLNKTLKTKIVNRKMMKKSN
jgi:hypothetical protein